MFALTYLLSGVTQNPNTPMPAYVPFNISVSITVTYD